MTLESKYVYIGKLDVIRQHNTYHSATKKKQIDVKSNTYIVFNVKKYEKDPKPGRVDHVIISKYKKGLEKCRF